MAKGSEGQGQAITWKDRFNYWFDKRISRGSLGLVKVLIGGSIALAVVIAGISALFGFSGEGSIASVLWDSISTLINAWMPSYEDGSLGYVLMMSIVAIAGVLFTSVLIGIITSAIEEKIIELKQGNSRVLEHGHTVVLGFYQGEYTLLRQLVLAAAGKPACVVVADDMDREEMEQWIKNNVEAPRNFRIVCRTADICDPSSLEKCSIETCKTVIISPTNDFRTIKSALAVSTLIRNKSSVDVRVNAILSKSKHRFPPSVAKKLNIMTLQTHEALAKMIAHSCTQNGLAETFKEVFNFEGSELYLIDLPKAEGLTFEQLLQRLDHAVPIGLFRDGRMRINPPASEIIAHSDRIVVFSETVESARLLSDDREAGATAAGEEAAEIEQDTTGVVIFGDNETLPIVIHELPEYVRDITIVSDSISDGRKRRIESAKRGSDTTIQYCLGDPGEESTLVEICRTAEHIVVLNDHSKEQEKADMETIFLLLNLRDIRARYDLCFNITAELSDEHNQKLAESDDRTDFVVTSSMSSLFLAQLANSPELLEVFREILSNEGNELYLKSAERMNLTGETTVRALRRRALRRGYILLGYAGADCNIFNPPLDEVVQLGPGDSVIVLGEK